MHVAWTVVKSAPWGNNFAAQLINGKTGTVIASCGTGDFNAYTSKDNLNGAHFQYVTLVLGKVLPVKLKFLEPVYNNWEVIIFLFSTGTNPFGVILKFLLIY